MCKNFSVKVINKNKGFTLVELLLVVLIISILTGISVGIVNSAGIRQKANDAQRVSDLRKIQEALELFYADNRRYPLANDFVQVTSGSVLHTSLETRFINNVPVDPSGDSGTGGESPCANPQYNRYNYRSDPTGSAYVLTATMELASSNDDNLCHCLNNWEAPFNLGIVGTNACGGNATCALGSYANADVCYGVENP